MANNSADAVRQQGEATAKAILDRASVTLDMAERTARLIQEATESYARHIESFVNFCEQAEQQSRTITAQLEPLAARPNPIDTEKMEREMREPPGGPPQMPRMPRMPGSPEPRR